MTHTNSSSSTRVSFCFGFLEGPWQSRQFRRQLVEQGFNISKPGEQSDVIIAHSAGCWLMPSNAKPKLTIYVGMPLAQGRPLRTLRSSIFYNMRHVPVMRFIKLVIANVYYALRQPIRNIKIVDRVATAEPVIPKSGQHVLIANQHDPWPKADKLQHYMATHDWAFISLPGSHDSLWHQPEQYIAIIKHYA